MNTNEWTMRKARGGCVIENHDGVAIAVGVAHGNAQLIVKSVAAHDELVAALADVSASLEALLGNRGTKAARELALREHPGLQAARALLAKVAL